MKTDLIPLNVTIGDRNYRIRVAPADEEAVRKTLKTINEKIIDFRGQFAGKDMQDYIAMVLLWYATRPQEEIRDYVREELLESLTKLEEQLRAFEE